MRDGNKKIYAKIYKIYYFFFIIKLLQIYLRLIFRIKFDLSVQPSSTRFIFTNSLNTELRKIFGFLCGKTRTSSTRSFRNLTNGSITIKHIQTMKFNERYDNNKTYPPSLVPHSMHKIYTFHCYSIHQLFIFARF